MGEVFHRRTNGKHAWGNAGVDYASPNLTADERAALNAGIRRVTEDAAAVRYMRKYYEPTAARSRRSSRCTRTTTASCWSRTRTSTARRSRRRRTATGSCALHRLRRALRVHQRDLPRVRRTRRMGRARSEADARVRRADCPTCRFTDQQPGPWGSRSSSARSAARPRARSCARTSRTTVRRAARAARSTAASARRAGRSPSRWEPRRAPSTPAAALRGLDLLLKRGLIDAGTSASVASSIFAIVGPASRWTVAVVWTRFGGKPAVVSCAARNIEKHPACAAPSSSSGFVADVSPSNRER
jgi:hypothetical protein